MKSLTQALHASRIYQHALSEGWTCGAPAGRAPVEILNEQLLSSEHHCPSCGTKGLAWQPLQRGPEMRTLAICESCGHVIEL